MTAAERETHCAVRVPSAQCPCKHGCYACKQWQPGAVLRQANEKRAPGPSLDAARAQRDYRTQRRIPIADRERETPPNPEGGRGVRPGVHGTEGLLRRV